MLELSEMVWFPSTTTETSMILYLKHTLASRVNCALWGSVNHAFAIVSLLKFGFSKTCDLTLLTARCYPLSHTILTVLWYLWLDCGCTVPHGDLLITPLLLCACSNLFSQNICDLTLLTARCYPLSHALSTVLYLWLDCINDMMDQCGTLEALI